LFADLGGVGVVESLVVSGQNERVFQVWQNGTFCTRMYI